LSSTNLDKIKKDIGERLRVVQGVDRLKDFAAEFGESPSQISQYKSGIYFPPIALLVDLSEKRNLNLHWLITGDGEMYTKKQLNNEIMEKYPALLGMKNLTDQFIGKVSETIVEYNAKSKELQEHKKSKK
jgi:transcriptional regulator with XRE-family HTH domain